MTSNTKYQVAMKFDNIIDRVDEINTWAHGFLYMGLTLCATPAQQYANLIICISVRTWFEFESMTNPNSPFALTSLILANALYENANKLFRTPITIWSALQNQSSIHIKQSKEIIFNDNGAPRSETQHEWCWWHSWCWSTWSLDADVRWR